jgi:two-component system, LytTR family, sensor kinase
MVQIMTIGQTRRWGSFGRCAFRTDDTVAVTCHVVWRKGRSEAIFGNPGRSTVAATLALANRTGPALRGGLDAAAARFTCVAVRELLSLDAVVVTSLSDVLAYDRMSDADGALETDRVFALSMPVLEGAEGTVAARGAGFLGEVVVVPLVVDARLVGTMQMHVLEADLVTVQACQEVARWISGQLAFGELDRARANATRAELRSLRAQINPHFLFNALSTMASFVRTDPERARELLVQFAEFARYSFSTDAQFTTLADELRAIDTFVSIERARFGDRFEVSIRVAPEVLATPVPFLTLQPLVENALSHGLSRLDRVGHLTIIAADSGNEARVSIEDDGLGADPSRIREILSGTSGRDGAHVGLANVDERLRMIYGSAYGLSVETALGAGMKVSLRFPKYRSGVRPGQ